MLNSYQIPTRPDTTRSLNAADPIRLGGQGDERPELLQTNVVYRPLGHTRYPHPRV